MQKEKIWTWEQEIELLYGVLDAWINEMWKLKNNTSWLDNGQKLIKPQGLLSPKLQNYQGIGWPRSTMGGLGWPRSTLS